MGHPVRVATLSVPVGIHLGVVSSLRFEEHLTAIEAAGNLRGEGPAAPEAEEVRAVVAAAEVSSCTPPRSLCFATVRCAAMLDPCTTTS
ncbi:MAG TPA: hypothetical protein VFL99_06935 [Segeticoccus sp.]|uniref:hypothetical protein n=1 Tax=Segeticoccus sp. TaxID=2706531 RepID=UPI002D7F2EFA|nr:hypothetical protein [Segeticoccus sp.]HET8600044.1 hypothetical protein [Segeticoccus sp.]